MSIQDFRPIELSKLIALSQIKRNPVGSLIWNYETGLFLSSLWRLANKLDDKYLLSYVIEHADYLVSHDGTIKGYKEDEYNLDQINTGKVLLLIYEKLGINKYLLAAERLRKQLVNQPRTISGGYWHKKIYPYQIWLDGLYMYGPFAVKWGLIKNEPLLIEEVIRNMVHIYNKTRDEKSGLLRHAWDESKSQRWADPTNGQSPHMWGRAMGWYVMALADILEMLPDTYNINGHNKKELIDIFSTILNTLVTYQDSNEKMWYQVLDRGHQNGNYLETSCSAMFCYGYAQAAKMKIDLYVNPLVVAEDTFWGISNKYLKFEDDGSVNLHGICKVAGLGGNPYRDGSYAYYINEPVIANDFKGVGPYILAGTALQ
ncbi:glycoside hydrolase family 105 protein [Gracilinema caldarium]|uniref:glycoside hydrolase family 88/105 protein n=1 Tax=Gracilinema caldarium TaxID=215591 RepID=UPI0026EFF5B3|nr:glycoside hydrolase family 88 protein [Gracilinema caldarium]